MNIRDLNKANHASLHPRRSVVIGCGGMGTEAAIHFKKLLAQHYDTNKSSIIQVLTFDSAQPDWQAPDDGQYLRPQDRQRIFVDNLEQLLRNLHATPRLDAWFPTSQREQAVRIAREVGHSVQGAASTRPFGRMGLFVHWQSIHDHLRRLIQAELSEFHSHTGETASVETDSGHVYLVASVGGGTGTGIFLDLAALTRKVLHDLGKSSWEVNAILVLPEILVRDPKIGSAYTQQIMANSYAALKELDHFMHGNQFVAQYGEGEASRVVIPGEGIGKLIDSVYLVDAENPARKVFTQRDQLAAMIGEMLFHLTATDIGRNLEHRLPDERARMFFQHELPELKPADRAVGLVQERRKCLYSTFGLSTLKIPVDSLLEYCAIQRALTLVELVGRVEVDDLDEATRRAEELYAGGSGELPRLSRIGLTSRQLDQALSLKRYFEELPEPDVILAEHSPATRLRQLYEGMRWSDDRFQEWTARARDAGDRLRSRYIRGEYREQKDHSPQRIEAVLKQQVDELSLNEGFPVVDRLLDMLEQGLVETHALTMQQIERARFDLGLSDGSEGHNKFSRILENLLEDIEGRQARNGFFRERRNRRRIGAWVVDALDLLRRFQPRSAHLASLQEKAAVCHELIEEINRLDDEVLPFRVQGLRFIKNQLRTRRNQVLATCRQEMSPVLSVSPNPQTLYKDHYLPLLGAGEQPASIAATIRKSGLLLQDGTRLSVDMWAERISEVEDALLQLCRTATELEDGEIPNQALGGAKGLWRLDFDSHVFSDPLPGEGESDLQRFAVMLKMHAEPYATYDLNDTPSQPWNVVLSGSCLGKGTRNWRQWFLSEGVNQVYRGLPNQVTLIMVRKAFPLFKLSRIREWKRYYDEYLGKNWPLHLFKDAADWQEPFITLENPCLCPAEELLHLAMTHAVITSDEMGQLAYSHPRPEIQALFQDEQGRRRPLSLPEFTALLETNRILSGEVLEDVAERIVQVEGGDIVRDPERLAAYDTCLAGVIRQLLGLTD